MRTPHGDISFSLDGVTGGTLFVCAHGAGGSLNDRGTLAATLLLLAYPLHPAGQPEMLRDAHLGDIRCPVLCINGTRDALCDRALMERALQSVRAAWTMHWLEGADHSFHVLQSSGRTDADVLREVTDVTPAWLGAMTSAPTENSHG